MSLIQAFVRNVATCRFDVKGETQLAALELRFKSKVLTQAREVMDRFAII
jgi:hypothetical protein